MSFSRRLVAEEQMDQPGLSWETYRGALLGLARVNRYLGGARSLFCALAPHVRPGGTYDLLDVGCGGGDLAPSLLSWARRRDITLNLTLLDLHPHAVRFTRERCGGLAGVRVVQADVMDPPFAPERFDLVTASLMLHHFYPPDLQAVLGAMARLCRGTVVINDLYRGAVPYWFIRLAGPLLCREPMFRHDGPVSVARGFRPKELLQWAGEAGLEQVQVKRVFPYRVILTGRTQGRPQ